MDLIPYPGNSLNRNLLSHNVRNPACLTALFFSWERVITHLPILASFPPEEVIRPPKWLKSLFLISRSSLERLISKGFSSPNIGRRKLLTTSSKVMVSSPTEKKNVWKEGHQRHTKCLRPLVSLKPSKFLKIATDFRIPIRSKQLKNSRSKSSLSTQLDQPVVFSGTKSKKMGTTSQDLRLICRSEISLGSGTWAELANLYWPENT